MKSKNNLLNQLQAAAKSSALTERPEIDAEATTAKSIKGLPVRLVDAFKALKAAGKTRLSFTSYIIVAIEEKLKRDGAL